MSLKIEIGTNIKCTDETGSYNFYEGDKIICHVGEKVYNGTISWIGTYKENSNLEPQQIICIDTFKSRTSMSRDMINVKDITFICKNPFYDSEKPYSAGQDILDTLIKKGYSKEQAKAICDRMSDLTVFYCTPYIKAETYAIEAVKNITSNQNNDKDIINELAKQCVEEAQKEYFELVDIYLKVIEQCDRDATCLTDILGIVSKCWDDLEKQKADRTEKISAN